MRGLHPIRQQQHTIGELSEGAQRGATSPVSWHGESECPAIVRLKEIRICGVLATSGMVSRDRMPTRQSDIENILWKCLAETSVRAIFSIPPGDCLQADLSLTNPANFLEARFWTTSRYNTSVRKPDQNCFCGSPVKVGPVRPPPPGIHIPQRTMIRVKILRQSKWFHKTPLKQTTSCVEWHFRFRWRRLVLDSVAAPEVQVSGLCHRRSGAMHRRRPRTEVT